MTVRQPALIDIPFERFTLDNGLTLLVHEDRKAPIVAVNVWYHVGSKNERPGKTGFAHLFEHLMFNGSEHFNDDYFQAMERIGATDLNGTTNHDRTNYFQNVPTPALDVALWMESDRMGHMLPAIDQAKLDEQRGVVKNEKRQGENQPYAIAHDLITKRTYPSGHPYSWTVIGEMEDLDGASLEDVHAWFRAYYGAANATLALAGDISPKLAREKVERYFGSIEPGPRVPRLREWIAQRTGRQRETVEDGVPQDKIYKVFNTPGWGTEDALLLDLATDVLSVGKSSRLYKRLVYEEQAATSARASIHPREVAGQVTVSAMAQAGQDLARLEALLDEEIERFLRDGPTEAELARVRTLQRASFVRGLERIGGFGGKSDILAKNQVYAEDPAFYHKEIERLEAATPETIRDAARRWLSDGSYTLEVRRRAKVSVSLPDADRSKLPKTGDFPSLRLPTTLRRRLSEGLEMLSARRPKTPTVEVSLVLDAGYAADPVAAPGTASLTMAMLDEGAGTRTSLEISDRLDELGAQMSCSAGLDACQVRLSALRENLEPSLELLAEVALEPTFPPAELERLKKLQLARIAQEMATPQAMGLRLLPRLLFGADHAYGAPLTGSGNPASVAALTRDDVAGFHKQWFTPASAALAVVGDIGEQEMATLAERVLERWPSLETPPAKRTPLVSPHETLRIYLVDKPGAEQSVVMAGLPGPSISDPNDIAISVWNDILGGAFTSRINMNLREDKHWTYGARSALVDARGPRLFVAYSAVQGDKTAAAMVEIDREIRGALGGVPLTDDEIEKAKQRQTLQLPGRFETQAALLSALREQIVYDFPPDYYQTYPAKVRALTREQMEAAGRSFVEPDRLTWVIVGDRAKVRAEIAALGWASVEDLEAA
ncbi:MAG: insulinase family protein [Acidobacteria bacterium]|nr:insulinase family protein [Acidobacteriota bacterium]